MKKIEFVGVACALIGCFIVAYGKPGAGYPILLASSGFLVYTARMQKNYNLMILQGSFLVANLLGVYKNSLHFFGIAV